MEVLLGVALAVVFAVSGGAKLLDRAGTREAVAGFGLPGRLVGPVATLLAPVELLTAVLLVVAAPVGFVLALALLTAFSVAVALALRAGRRPECHCFGRLGAADVSARTLVRNGVLSALAVTGLVAAAGGSGRPEATAAAVLGGLALAGLVVLAEALAGQAARRRRARDDERAFDDGPGHTRAPEFRLPSLTGGTTGLDDLLAPGRPLLLITLSPGCGPCKALRPDVGRWAELLGSRVSVAVLATGTVEQNLAAYAEMPHLPVLVDVDGVREELGTSGTPSAVLIGTDRRLLSGVAGGERLVRRLLAEAATDGEIGDEDPDTSGRPVDSLTLDDVVGPRPTVEVHELDGAALLLDRATGATVTVDQLGALVWSVLDGTAPLAEIVRDLADVFGAPADVVGADVLELVRALGQAGLLADVSPVERSLAHAE